MLTLMNFINKYKAKTDFSRNPAAIVLVLFASVLGFGNRKKGKILYAWMQNSLFGRTFLIQSPTADLYLGMVVCSLTHSNSVYCGSIHKAGEI